MEEIALRYYDTKMHVIYSLEYLRSEYYNDPTTSNDRFDDWLNNEVNDKVLIPIY